VRLFAQSKAESREIWEVSRVLHLAVMFSGKVERKSNLELNVFKLTSSLEKAGRNCERKIPIVFTVVCSLSCTRSISQVPTLSSKMGKKQKEDV
jgi:hypothetical protein